MLLALNNLTDMKVNANNGSGDATIEIGPGNRWEDVYGALEPYGLYSIGGRMKVVGVPGLSLIGGMHYFNNKYGYSMDQMISYDVVLGNGTQVVATATENPDLFWALKGGALNFGIVTKFTMKAYYVPKVSTTMQLYNASYTEDYINAFVDMALNNNGEIGAGSVYSIQYNATTKVLESSIMGIEESEISPPSRFVNFSAIPAETRINNVTTPAYWHSTLESPNQYMR